MRRILALAAATALLALAALPSCADDPSTLGSTKRVGTSGGTSGTGTSGTSGDGTSGTSGSGTSGTSGTGTSGTPAGSTAADVCFNTINMYRQTKGLPPYAHWTEMETCADGEAKSDGTTRAAHGAFGMCGENAQNECPGWPGPADTMIPMCLAAMWAEGPGGGHYEAMISQQYTKVSCGFGVAPDGQIWAVQNFR